MFLIGISIHASSNLRLPFRWIFSILVFYENFLKLFCGCHVSRFISRIVALRALFC